jgi:ParB family chromosome partitioning protein
MEQIYFIEVEKILPNPYQPRKIFSPESLQELAESIKEFGILEPLIVTRKEIQTENGIDVWYELVAGERRLQAAKLIGLKTVPAIIKELSDKAKLEVALIENIQREDLNPIERAKAFARLMEEFGMTQIEIASRIGKSRAYVANTIRLLKLPEEIQEALKSGKISEAHARILLSIENIELQKKIFLKIINEGLTLQETQKLKENKKEQKELDPEIAFLKRKLEEILQSKVDIQKSEDGKIKVSVKFFSTKDLWNFLEILNEKNLNE